jgi:hypothetical protein
MLEHPSSQILEQYNRRTLSPDLFLVVSKHVSACPACSERSRFSNPVMEDYDNLWSALMPSPLDEPYHLSTGELFAYAKNSAGEIDGELAESHLEVCGQCREQMREAREAIKADAVEVKEVVPRRSPSGFLDAVRAYPAKIFQPRAAQFAALALVAGVLVVLVLSLIRTRTDERTAERQSPIQNVNGIANQAVPQTLSQSNRTSAQVNVNALREEESDAATLLPEREKHESSSAGIVRQLNDGGRQIVLDERGDLKGAEQLPYRLQQAIRAALATGKLERPSYLSGLNGKPGTFLGESGDGLPFKLIGPVGKVLASNRPTFRWVALAGASHYIVTVTDARLNAVATSDALTVLEWSPPVKLKGGIYSWQVTAVKDGRRVTSPVLPAPEAKFRVLEQEKVKELERARQTFRGSHLTLGLLLTEAGLLDEAEREFGLLLKVNPDSQLARKLLAQARAMQRG